MIKVGAGGAEVSSTIRGGVRTPFLGFASDPPAALYQAAVTGDERDAEDVVAHRAEALAQRPRGRRGHDGAERSEEHTSELQSLAYLVCRLLLEKKKMDKQNKSCRCSSPLYAR